MAPQASEHLKRYSISAIAAGGILSSILPIRIPWPQYTARFKELEKPTRWFIIIHNFKL
jgi:hypothetical protein